MIVPRTTAASPSAASTGWPSLPALTTIFTPPASCSDLPFTYTDSGFWRDAALSRTECYPPLYLPPPNWNEYSPGVCPARYTPNLVNELTYTNGVVETYAYCCPFSMELITMQATTTSSNLLSSQADPYVCGQLISTPTWYMNGSQTISTSGLFTGYASGMWAEWEQKDLSLFTPASAPILGFKHLGGAATSHSSPSTTGSSMGRPASSHSGLSVGAKAGIGVGVGIAVLLFFGVAFLFMRRLHQQSEFSSHASTVHPRAELDPKADIVEAPAFAKRHEAAGSDTYAEKRYEQEAVELDGNWHGHEVADTSNGPEKDPESRSSSIAETPARFFRPSNWL